MSNSRLKAAVLIISDTAYVNHSLDESGVLLAEALAIDGGDKWTLERITFLPDEIPEIQKELLQLCDSEEWVNLIITTGGTGFSARDHTPEAITPLIHKHAPGLV